MSQRQWLDRWDEGRIGFHLDRVNPALERFLPRFLARPGKVFVPLCGKSLDLLYLEQNGHEVIAIELARRAAEAFHTEAGRPFVVAEEGPLGVVHTNRIRYYIGDFFELPELEGVDLTYDRAALIALSGADRQRYAHRLQEITQAAPILLVGLEYDQDQMSGPPYCVARRELPGLYPAAQIEILDEREVLDENPRFRERGVQRLIEYVASLRFERTIS